MSGLEQPPRKDGRQRGTLPRSNWKIEQPGKPRLNYGKITHSPVCCLHGYKDQSRLYFVLHERQPITIVSVTARILGNDKVYNHVALRQVLPVGFDTC